MVFRHYCLVLLNPKSDLSDEIIKISESQLRAIKGKGISIYTFTSVVDTAILSDYFKSFEVNFLLFELDKQTSAYNFNDKIKEDDLFGFINDYTKINEYEELSNKLLDDIISENIGYVSGSTNNINKSNTSYTSRRKKDLLVDDEVIDEEIKDLTKSEINERLNKIIDKGLDNLTEFDKKMLESINKKQNCPLYSKIASIYVNAIIKNRTFISWEQIENYLDTIIERIRHSGENYDAVVGIKTGGAIISDYISLKLGIPNYKVKLSLSEYNCNKQPINVVDDIFKKMVLNNYGEFTVCEGIDESLEGKNIILIDELVASGRTMTETYKYLKNEKHVGNIYATSVALYKKAYKGHINIDYVLPQTVLIWPWGYDN